MVFNKGETMESMLKKVNELEGLLIKSLLDQEKIEKENECTTRENKEIKALLNKKAKDLKAREEVIKPIEDVAEFKVKADKVMKEANKNMKLALAQQDIADKKNLENRQEHSKQKDRIVAEDARILDDKAGLKKGYDQLKKAQDEAESKVYKAIAGKIRKG